MNKHQVPDEHIEKLDQLLKNIDSEIALSMAYVRRTHRMPFSLLESRTTGVTLSTLKKYMQPSYDAQRPLHVVAGLSWVMMVPMTAFYHGLRLKENYRGMGDTAVEALVRIGRLPERQFNAVLDMIANFYSEENRDVFQVLREDIKRQSIEHCLDYDKLFPPPVLDFNKFGEDYYRSVAITLRRFREEHGISAELASRVLGLSPYQFSVLENRNKPVPFSVSIGFRTKLGFQLNSHVNFTSEMATYPEFHKLRIAQHHRDTLIVEAMRRLNKRHKQHVSKIIEILTKAYL